MSTISNEALLTILDALVRDRLLEQIKPAVEDAVAKLDFGSLVTKALDDIDLDEKIEEALDYETLASRVLGELDISDLASSVVSELDYGDIADEVQQRLDMDDYVSTSDFEERIEAVEERVTALEPSRRRNNSAPGA